jgi:REP element-mobilizing transposase RayT
LTVLRPLRIVIPTGVEGDLLFCASYRNPEKGPRSRTTIASSLKRVRQQYALLVHGYVVMPEHVHLLVSEPERDTLARAMQSLKQSVTRRLALQAATNHHTSVIPSEVEEPCVWQGTQCSVSRSNASVPWSCTRLNFFIFLSPYCQSLLESRYHRTGWF